MQWLLRIMLHFDSNEWLVDSGANIHVTVDGNNITHLQPLVVGNGAGLIIKNTGFSHVCSNSFTKFHLKDIVHYPDASINVLSIHKFCRDNHIVSLKSLSIQPDS